MKDETCRITGHVEGMKIKRNVCSILMGKPEGKRPLGRRRRGWVEFRERIGWYVRD
jgi:hypothetical protein